VSENKKKVPSEVYLYLANLFQDAILPSSMSSSTPRISSQSNGVELYRDDYVYVVGDPDGIVVRTIRTVIAHPSPEILEESYLQVTRALDGYGRSGRGLLVDVRDAIGRNEPRFEAALARTRKRNDAGFARIAVLLRTQAGMLQMMRLSDEDGTLRLITMDERVAVEYLRTGLIPSEVRPATGKNEIRR